MPKERIQEEREQENLVKYTVKDSVFTNLFKEKEYLLQLYKVLHPEDADVTEDSFTEVTIKNILVNKPYNDLGFLVGERLLILVEAQSSWSVNFIVRAFLYLAQSYQDYFRKCRMSIHREKKLALPVPELYIVYTGDRKERPEYLSLTEEFFGGEVSSLEVKVHMLYDGEKGDILNQYVAFTKVYDDQRRKYGRTKRAIVETIRICKDRDILKKYLEEREKEVVDIMMTLYDEEQMLREYIESERHDAAQEGIQKGIQEGFQEGIQQAEKEAKNAVLESAKKMLRAGGFTVEQIADFLDLPVGEVNALAVDTL